MTNLCPVLYSAHCCHRLNLFLQKILFRVEKENIQKQLSELRKALKTISQDMMSTRQEIDKLDIAKKVKNSSLFISKTVQGDDVQLIDLSYKP